MTAYSQGMILLDVAADQAAAFIRCVIDPPLSFAAWTSVRAVLETTALAAWLLDPLIEVRDRVRRSNQFMYEGLVQQRKLLKPKDENDDPDNLAERIKDLKTRKGPKEMPKATDMIGRVLGAENDYRLLSAVTHGHIWALNQLGLRTVNNESFASWDSIYADTKAVQKHLRPDGAVYLCRLTACSLTKGLWCAASLVGDQEVLTSILERNFDLFGFNVALRHWRAN